MNININPYTILLLELNERKDTLIWVGLNLDHYYKYDYNALMNS